MDKSLIDDFEAMSLEQHELRHRGEWKDCTYTFCKKRFELAQEARLSEGKPQRLRSTAYGLCFAASYPLLAALARQHGYALAIHGSMATDFDLVAVPWTAVPSHPEELIETIRSTVNGYIENDPLASEFDETRRNPVKKLHGRLAWSIYLNEGRSGPYLDVSVMPTSLPVIDDYHAQTDHNAVTRIWNVLGNPECDGRHIWQHVEDRLNDTAGEAAKRERIRIVAYLSYDTVYSDDFCVRCSHCPSNCECPDPIYMAGWTPTDELKALKVALFQELIP